MWPLVLCTHLIMGTPAPNTKGSGILLLPLPLPLEKDTARLGQDRRTPAPQASLCVWGAKAGELKNGSWPCPHPPGMGPM